MSEFRRRLMMVGGGALPYDAEVEYLESDGNQWIEIRSVTYSTSNSYLIECKAMSTNNRQDNALNGWDAGGAFGFRYNGYSNGDGSIYGDGSYNAYSDISLLIRAASNTQSTMTVNVGGTTYTRSRAHGSLANYAKNRGYHLFACWSNTSVQYKCKERIYYCKIYVNDVLVKDLVPVRIEQTGYLYDKVSGELYQNSGSGSFILGNDIN